ncbi:hypothetical protein [Cytobacillus oceanisediminis]|uniref:Uncharacterized protein n=1 Tax=Cytobacillus oceanisediminis 2691 TaxID=1196031 RepID=A0A160MDI4_9BACI|nr:hypothetical protein [Cytobacillus oceanisediminis]AND40773.1 hypothetical protein A361_16980 [Cytobacillus oceanisediminis 2691]MCM3243318.1 hypothetical protein [Cytobacillus oceanisediminis]
MNPYEITSMIIDDEFDGEEYVTTEFLQENNTFSITFKKADLEVINAWVFNDGSSIPANLSEEMIESIRNSVKKRIGRK